MIIYKDEKFGFCEIFNEENGTLIRSDINGIEPVMRSFPELLDVGIMGHCDHNFACILAGIDCYQNGYSRETPHMSLKDYECIARQASGKTFQIALGGAGMSQAKLGNNSGGKTVSIIGLVINIIDAVLLVIGIAMRV